MKSASKAFHASMVGDQRGVTIILVVLMMFVFLGIAALAVDVSALYVARNELQNAADAGALAGARFLYTDDGTAVSSGANQIAYDAATANRAISTAGLIPVEVNWTSGQNSGDNVDVQRGHWSFATRTFTANDSLSPVDLANRSTAELDQDLNFINAVRVVARRYDFPAFFARILDHEDFDLSAEAVGYIGFAASLRPEDVDQPIGICRQSIVDADGNYTCNTGRMIDSGSGTTHNTAAWTNFSQPCETASANSVSPLVCGEGNPEMLDFGNGMGTTGGMQDNVYRDLRDCWLNAPLPKDVRGLPIEPWEITLAVIDCPGNNPGPCSELRGVVTLNVLWIKESGTDPHWTDIPLQMGGWSCSLGGSITELSDTQRQQCWQEFAAFFELQTSDGTSVGTLTPNQLQKTMFFLPSCEAHEPRGTTGGENYGVLARIPVLVK